MKTNKEWIEEFMKHYNNQFCDMNMRVELYKLLKAKDKQCREEKIIKCGDANPKGNIALFYKGGCKKPLKIEEAYRCVGCGGYFHLDCILKHFELEEGHDNARYYLKKIQERTKDNMVKRYCRLGLEKPVLYDKFTKINNLFKKPIEKKKEKYTKATCKGSYFFGTACGKCEKCKEQLNKINNKL